jgi:hypothetical protein
MQRSDANTLSPLPGIFGLTYWNVPQNVPQNVLDLFVPPRVPQRRGGVSVLLDPLNVICTPTSLTGTSPGLPLRIHIHSTLLDTTLAAEALALCAKGALSPAPPR